MAQRAGATSDLGAPARRVGACVGLAAALTVLALVPWGDDLLGAQGWMAVVIASGGTLLFAMHSVVNGSLAGEGRWRGYGTLVGTESGSRLALITLLVLLAARSDRLNAAEFGTALAAGSWMLLVLFSRDHREAFRAQCDRGLREMLATSGRSMTGAIGNSIILVGFPVLLSLTTPAHEYARAAPFLLAISLTRAPIMLPLSAFQSMVITHFMETSDRRSVLLRLGAAVSGVTLIGAGLAAVVGPPLMQLLFGPSYRVGSAALAVLTVAAGLIALETIVGALLMALARHRTYAVAWLTTACVSAAVLLLPNPMPTRAMLALTVGPAVGIVVQLVSLSRHSLSGLAASDTSAVSLGCEKKSN